MRTATLVGVVVLLAGGAWAQEEDAGVAPLAALPDAGAAQAVDAGVPPPPNGLVFDTAVGTFRLWGTVEVFYQWNFNRPSNGLTQFRAFDTRHNAITLQNVALGVEYEARHVFSRVTAQAGHTAFTYYLGEPRLPGSAGATASGPQFWQFLQEAVLGYAFDDGKRFKVSGGLFLSPIGPEAMNLKDEWFWSRSNLFFAFPFYHAGLTAQLGLTERWTLTAGVVNGYLNVVDNNPEKSVLFKAAWSPSDRFGFHVLYFGGVERPAGAAEGRAWRHMLDVVAVWQASERVSLKTELNGGLEPNAFGVDAWGAGQLAVRVMLVPWLYAAVRADVLFETTPAGGTPIFFPSPWVTSASATLEVKPLETIALRLEYRHDQAGAPMYFGGQVPADGRATFALQDTLTLGAVAWF